MERNLNRIGIGRCTRNLSIYSINNSFLKIAVLCLCITNTVKLYYFSFDLYLANETSDKFDPVDIFVPYDLRNNLICYMTLFGHSDILYP